MEMNNAIFVAMILSMFSLAISIYCIIKLEQQEKQGEQEEPQKQKEERSDPYEDYRNSKGLLRARPIEIEKDK